VARRGTTGSGWYRLPRTRTRTGTGTGTGNEDRIPTLEAPPWRLRPFEESDLELVAEASRDPVIPLVSSVPRRFDPDAGRRYLRRHQRSLRDGYGYSFVIAGPDGRGVGSLGVWLRDVDLGRASIGYWVLAGARGRGAASSALGAASRWALGELGIPRLELWVEPWNVASVRTAEHAGFRLEGLLRSWQAVDGERRDMYGYSLLAADLDEDPGPPSGRAARPGRP
jgi:RimJ/RimL family protein N-acetyltransferase